MFFPDLYPLIYFDKKLEDYYIIGQTEPIFNSIYPGPDSDELVNITMLLTRIYAGKKAFFKKEKIPLSHASYVKAQKHYELLSNLIPKQNLSYLLEKNYKYTRQSMKAGKDFFLIGLSCEIPEFEWLKQEPYLNYHSISRSFFGTLKYEKPPENFPFGGIFNHRFSERLWTEIVGEEEDFLMTLNEYKKSMTNSFMLETAFDRKEPLNDADLTILNTILQSIPPKDNPLIDFMYSFMEDALVDMEEKRILKVCPVCRQAFRFKESKIYCSVKCAKKKHHERYYTKHKLELIPKVKERMQELRQFYKEKGVMT